MNKEMLKGTIDLLILSTLSSADNYGYEISKEIKERTEGMFEIQEATLYLALKRLEKNNFVEAYWGTESQGGKRKYYHLTDLGIEQLEQMKADWTKISEMVHRFL
ncbi:PadR family transcriptional regulator [Bacillus sp. XF8]|uniref:PadR family transcriptional regulator n=1 Tax=Bacillus sp. XF8 TaxID=2819289 RepID=UPI001AA0A57A|nr:helix-turn-helix transcriptional regulator [Bacillus sp. XF8]MBO1583248.1 helix-turn-helix transcriptional regulator [Bacillus sp. XF8]